MATAAKKKRTILDRLDPQNINPGLFPVYPSPEEALKNPKKLTHEIIAIPGLGAPEEFTWSRGGVHWLRDSNMLPFELPTARISVFQYKSQWFGKGSVDPTVDTVANQLLYELERLRGDDCKTPIIFVCHCLGGIILEQALLTARAQQDIFPSVFPFVAGCIFLGTPFNGTKTQKKAMVLARLAEQVGFGIQSNLLKLIGEDSRELKKLLREFVPLYQQSQIRVFSFFEGEPSDVGGYAGLPFASKETIVDEDSATWPGVERLLLDCDHFKLNKYTGPKDSNYRSVSNQIKVTAQRAEVILKSRQKALLQLQVNDRTYRAILDALRRGFSDLEVATHGYFHGPKPKESKTKDSQAQESKAKQSAWIMEVKNYKTWSDHEAPQLLWVHGKAGTGQDSIATSVINNLKQAGDYGPLVASFFCDQGDENRRTLKGLLKILIYQIIDRRQDLAEHLLTDSKKGSKVGSQEFDENSFTDTAFLWERLQTMVRRASPTKVYVVINGLEQLSGESLKEFFELLKDIPAPGSAPDENSDAVHIKWLLFSRTGRSDIKTVLEPQAMAIDIDADENSNVDELVLPAPLAFLVKQHTHARADDNSIYVSVVIQELKNVYTSGKSQAEIRALLESFPYGLTDMFTHVRKRVLDSRSEGIEYTKEILRCLILAQRAPTMRELAIMAGLPEYHRNNLEELKAYIVRCGAFVSLRGWEWDEDAMTVEWIDPSAQEHLEEYAREELCLGLSKMQHGIIALRCLEHIYSVTDRIAAVVAIREAREANVEANAQIDGQVDTTQDDPQPGSDVPPDEAPADENEEVEAEEEEGNEEFDAVHYAVQYWIEHAKLAPPEDLLDEIPWLHPFWEHGTSKARDLWWAANDDSHPLPGQTNVSVFHIAVATGFGSLVEYCLNFGWGVDINQEDSLGFQPLYYACMHGNNEIMQTLLGAGVDPNYISDVGQVPAIYAAAYGGHNEIIQSLLDLGADIEAGHNDYGNALYAATQSDHIETMRLLLNRGAKVNALGGWHRTSLNVRLLLDSGADIDPDLEYPYGSALGAASRRGHTDVVTLLLSRGWRPNKEMDIYRTFLTAAATYGHLGVVEALVVNEADITVLDQALQASSQKGQTAVVKCILDRTPTLRHERAFMLAAFYGHDEVLKLLHSILLQITNTRGQWSCFLSLVQTQMLKDQSKSMTTVTLTSTDSLF
ncbi:hypothetical protein P154DRAFT_588739 [Amniculicola lignicola CBS 123094]|uniref:Nephrocystin 3-like N-terminal domain-containing protein n=1 Tax=Amniculicola lignicola CBS 123094 TaxID=1392246 RepID=A0A6A5WQD2_9PLEO|nr:hypothetical protein P154DRAFT_588739 [Amniculicola lignicola CBS 123094]